MDTNREHSMVGTNPFGIEPEEYMQRLYATMRPSDARAHLTWLESAMKEPSLTRPLVPKAPAARAPAARRHIVICRSTKWIGHGDSAERFTASGTRWTRTVSKLQDVAWGLNLDLRLDVDKRWFTEDVRGEISGPSIEVRRYVDLASAAVRRFKESPPDETGTT